MKRLALVPAVVVAAATSGIAIGAAPANAATCPAPKVVVTASHNPILPGTAISLHGYNFDCAGTGNVHVTPQMYSTSTGQQGNGQQVSVSKGGEWVFSDLAAPSQPGPVTVRIDGPPNYLNANAFSVVAVGASPSTPLPTAVPAGHVDAGTNGDHTDAIELAGLAGLALVGAGAAAGARRRTSRRLNG